MGLAKEIGRGACRLADGLEETLRRMGERGDIIRTMQRAFAGRGDAPAPADRVLYDPSVSGARGLVGRVVERGLSDELRYRHSLLAAATDGRPHYFTIRRADYPAPP